MGDLCPCARLSEQYVLRRWDITDGRGPRRAKGNSGGGNNQMIPTSEIVLAETLEEIRKQVPAGLYRLERFADDNPCIVEVWV